jgi:hypothetical protein
MMDQYGPQDPGKVNPAVAPTTPYTYKPPVPQRLLDEQKARADYDAKVAADKLAYTNAALTPENFDEKDYITRYPDAFQDAPGRPYQHYLEANAAGDKRIANKLPFTPTPFTLPPLFGPTAQGVPVAAPVAAPVPVDSGGGGDGGGDGGGGERAGGLLSLKHKRKK